jgi:hypothetical protein
MFFILLLFVLSACQSNDSALDASVKRKNQKGEYIFRKQDESTAIPPMTPVIRQPYPWEHGKIPSITKEFFRCKGSALNSARSETVRGEVVKYHDCGGKHSLPLKNGKEWIYPVLIDILNHLQMSTGKRAIITSAHRCPEHNTYVDPSPLNQYSKHQMGAEVDFYIQGMEDQPEKVVQLILDYYQNHTGGKAFTEFKRYEKNDTNVSTQPWMNKEIFIKLFKPKEGRNYDNRHPYPYISLQVRYDREKDERVAYSWDQAFRNFLRY